MSTVSVSNPVGRFSEERVHGPRLAGGWRIAGISAWAAIWLMSLAAFVAATAIWYCWDSTPAAQLSQYFPRVTAESMTFESQYKENILQIDDHTLFREGVKALLSTTGDIEVVCEASDGETALQAFQTLHPNVVLMDINMPGMNGIEATRKLLQVDARAGVIMVTMLEDDASVFAAGSERCWI